MACWKIAHYFDAFPSENLHGTGFPEVLRMNPKQKLEQRHRVPWPFWWPLFTAGKSIDFPVLFLWSASKTRVLTLVPMNPRITANKIGTLTHQLGDGPLGMEWSRWNSDAGGFSIYPNHPESLALNKPFVAGSSFGIHFLLKVQCFFSRSRRSVLRGNSCWTLCTKLHLGLQDGQWHSWLERRQRKSTIRVVKIAKRYLLYERINWSLWGVTIPINQIEKKHQTHILFPHCFQKLNKIKWSKNLLVATNLWPCIRFHCICGTQELPCFRAVLDFTELEGSWVYGLYWEFNEVILELGIWNLESLVRYTWEFIHC